MSIKEIAGFAIFDNPDGGGAQETPNYAFKTEILRYATSMAFSSWGATNYPGINLYPWKSAFGYDTDNLNVKHGYWYDNLSEQRWPGGNYANMSSKHYWRFRFSGSIASWSTAVNARAFAGLLASDVRTLNDYGWTGNILSLAEFPKHVTQIGLSYPHPVHTSTCSTTSGQPYVNATNNLYMWKSGCYDWFRITSGADQGLFQVAHFDSLNNRLYLKHLDGNMFSASATASGLTCEYAYRRAFFNETLVIKQSTGDAIFSGKYTPGIARQPGMFRIKFEKTGSDEAETNQRGSYYFSFQPWYYGEGAQGDYYRSDESLFHQSRLLGFGDTGNAFQSSMYNCNGTGPTVAEYAFDETAQRLWFISQGSSATSYRSGIYWWYYKSAESWHEVACNHASGAGASGAGDVATPIAMTGVEARTVLIGSDRKVYVALGIYTGGGTTNCGLVVISPTGYPVSTPMAVQQYKTADWANYATLSGIAIDKSRYRSYTLNLDTTGGPPGVIDRSGGVAFTQSDLGRAIKINSGVDAGTYLISNVVSGTSVEVTTMAGGPVTFTGSRGVSGEIGDRIYLFFQDSTTNNAKLHYVESLSPATVLFKTVTMTNGRYLQTRPLWGSVTSADVDQTTGYLFWTSQDTVNQANRYDPTTNTVVELSASSLATVTAGTPTPATPSTITALYALRVNPKFDEVWMGAAGNAANGGGGMVKMKKSTWAAADVARYVGINSSPTVYQNPSGVPRSAGVPSSYSYGTNNSQVFNVFICPDGHVVGATGVNGGAWESGNVGYGREADNFFMYDRGNTITEPSYIHSIFFDPYGGGVVLSCGADAGYLGHTIGREMNYQYIGGVWTPKEVARGVLPGTTPADSITAGCLTKELHSGAEDLIYGIKVAFDKQGGATPANNEFLGRFGQVGAVRTDGSTTVVASATTQLFTGSGFTAGDVGRYLRIHSGVNQSVYIITLFNSAISVTVKRASGVSFAWAGGSPETGQTYSIWDAGTAQVNAGPECWTVPVSDGLLKDTSQTLSGLGYEFHMFKTKMSEFDEPIKFCVDPPGVQGALQWEAKFMNYVSGSAQYDAALFGHKKMENHPSNTFNARVNDLIFGDKDMTLNGTATNSNAVKFDAWSQGFSADNYWRGIQASNLVKGYAITVDFKKNVEIGYIAIYAQQDQDNYGPQFLRPSGAGGNYSGVYAATDGVDVSTDTTVADARYTGGAGLAYTSGATTLSATSLLGPTVTSDTDGSTIASENKFYSTSNPFISAHEGHILQVSTGANPSDIGYYRIIEVDGSGNWVRIRNLDQTEKTWVGTIGLISWTLYNGVREDDMIVSPSIGTPTHRFAVLRLTSPTVAQVQILGGTTLAGATYDVIKPKWRRVKRLSNGYNATPPDEKDNKTWGTSDGPGHYTAGDWRLHFDFTDLPSAKRTGRYWKFAAHPRSLTLGDNNSGGHNFSGIEFYNTSGNRIGFCSYNRTDATVTEADFMASNVSRLDFIQCSNLAMPGGIYNGNVNRSASGSVTLNTGGNKFLGFQTRPIQTDGSPTLATNTFVGTGFIDSDKGRFLWIQNGTNAGYYRITTVGGATSISVATPSGGAVTFVADTPGRTYSLHEGIQVGTSGMDYINFGAVDSGEEWPIRSISDNLETLTVDYPGVALSNVAFEIRRRAINTYTAGATDPQPNSSYTARLLFPAGHSGSFPQQIGDVYHGSNGYLRFWANDTGNRLLRTDGDTTISTGTFKTVANTFVQDDIGRVIQIKEGSDIGWYRISGVTSATEVTVVDLFTGGAVSFAATASSLDFTIHGERRFRLARYATVVRA